MPKLINKKLTRADIAMNGSADQLLHHRRFMAQTPAMLSLQAKPIRPFVHRTDSFIKACKKFSRFLRRNQLIKNEPHNEKAGDLRYDRRLLQTVMYEWNDVAEWHARWMCSNTKYLRWLRSAVFDGWKRYVAKLPQGIVAVARFTIERTPSSGAAAAGAGATYG